jgi:hypothetical protein
MHHVASFSDDQWKILQELSAQRNPASFIREIVERYIRDALLQRAEGQTRVVHADFSHTAPAVNELLEGRWKALGCGKRVFDNAFNMARDWYVSHFSSEEGALTELEERHENEQLNNPRAWLYKNWVDAGRPGK